MEESKFVCVHILYCRIIVGAPMGTFPGGLPLSDPGQPAENQTGLVYSCPVQPGVCEGVRGDTNITAADIDANMATVLSYLPNNGPVIEGRLFDQARKNIIVSGLSKNSNNNDIHRITCQLKWVWLTLSG